MSPAPAPRYDVAHACAHLRAQIATGDPVVIEQSRTGEHLADHMASHFGTISNAALAGHVLTIAAGALTGLVAELTDPDDRRDDAARVVVNVLGFAGLHLIDQAQAATS
jgi:hypothetical protein